MTDDTENNETGPISINLSNRPLDGEAIRQVIDLVEKYLPARVTRIVDPVSGEMAPAILTPNALAPVPTGYFDGYLPTPRFRQGKATFTSLDSFIDHANRFKDVESALFADDDRARPSLTSVLDYHQSGPASERGQRHGKHRGEFPFPLSDEWQAWTKSDGAPMKMRDFAAFIEERVVDVLQLIPEEDELPEDLQKFIAALGGEQIIASPQKLVELSRGLQVNEASTVASAVSLASGEGEVVFKSQHQDAYGDKLKVPGLFLLAVPVFRNDAFYRLAARLRYRKTAEGIVFWYDLYRADRVFDDAFKRGCERARVETGLPLFFGKPE